ncbi:MAG: hypothetical protein FD174_3657 [Geobacteraceae bacterium]|nr:MAG: hypothetical protein FD174_3657 [Geobacteraceae bacterium]
MSNFTFLNAHWPDLYETAREAEQWRHGGHSIINLSSANNALIYLSKSANR